MKKAASSLVIALTAMQLMASVSCATAANYTQATSPQVVATVPNNGTTGEAPAANDLGMSLPGFEWSLPCEGKLDSQTGKVRQQKTLLMGTVTAYDVDNDFGELIDGLLDSALFTTGKMDSLDKSVAHFRTKGEVTKSSAKDWLNMWIGYRGNSNSSKAADVILNQKIKVTDKPSAEYARQRFIDETHPQVIAKTLQLALAMGTKDEARRDELMRTSLKGLADLVGQAKAELAMQKLEAWSKDVKVPDALYETASYWDVDFFRSKTQQVTTISMNGDPVMMEILKRLHKYNSQSTVKRASQKVIETGLNLASFVAPGYAIPLAIEVVNAAYIMATGGPEEAKLLKELYYDKRVESRYRVLNEEAQLALSQYQNALNQKNPVLLAACESVLTQLVGAENISQVLGGRTLLAHHTAGAKAIETAHTGQTH